jgi:PncC family amidohydrolase
MVNPLARKFLTLLKRNGLSVVTAESCTAGLLAKTLSDAPGAAEHLSGGFVTYTKQQKEKALGVSSHLLRTKGAVCREVASELAEGALKRSVADIAIAVTGVAGPDPDEDGNPVGRVIVGVCCRGRSPVSSVHRLSGSRHHIRRQAVDAAIRAASKTARKRGWKTP